MGTATKLKEALKPKESTKAELYGEAPLKAAVNRQGELSGRRPAESPVTRAA